MTHKILRFALALVGGALGAGLVVSADSIIVAFGMISLHYALFQWAIILIYSVSVALFAIIFYIFSPRMIEWMSKMLRLTEDKISTMPLIDVAFSILGLFIGLFVAFLFSMLIGNIPLPWLVAPLSVGVYILCGYLGLSAALKRRGGTRNPDWSRTQINNAAKPKILDTSVIIDGRIFDVCNTGIMEGTLVVPGFVLQELRHIADSADTLKRARGRRGLDVLNRMQKELPMTVRVEDRDYPDIAEVDLKLLKLAQDLTGVVVTNDYNLNKVAGVQNVPVFNINELANAIKPVVIPGEELQVAIVKEGKEQNQGVGYFDDGTMIVVEGGKKLMGEEVLCVVTSVLQTSAGRMIFARVK